MPKCLFLLSDCHCECVAEQQNCIDHWTSLPQTETHQHDMKPVFPHAASGQHAVMPFFCSADGRALSKFSLIDLSNILQKLKNWIIRLLLIVVYQLCDDFCLCESIAVLVTSVTVFCISFAVFSFWSIFAQCTSKISCLMELLRYTSFTDLEKYPSFPWHFKPLV